MPAPVAPGSRSVGDMLDAAFSRFKSGALKCLPMMLPAVLAGQMAEYYWLLSGHRGVSPFQARDGTYLALYVAGFVMYLLFASAATLQLASVHAGKPLGGIEQLRRALGRWPAMVATFVLAAVVTAACLLPVAFVYQLSVLLRLSPAVATAGSMLLLAPAVYVMVAFSVLLPVVLLEQSVTFRALRRSFDLVRPRWVRVFAALLIAGLAAVICLVAAWAALQMLLGAVGPGNAPLANAIMATALLLAFSLVQLFMLSLALEIYSSASASA